MYQRWVRHTVAVLTILGLAACGNSTTAKHTATAPTPTTSTDNPSELPADTASASASALVSGSASPSASKKPAPKPTTTLQKAISAGSEIPAGTVAAATSDGVPTSGAGTFTMATGGTDQVGTGATLVKYRIEVENGITWGANPVWTPTSFAAAVDIILAGTRGWTDSADHPITNAAEKMTGASWSFQRVSTTSYSVRVLLATPDTVDKLCGSVGLQTLGQVSCRYGTTEVINLRRWLKGVTDFGTDLTGYRNMVINHEMGHFLGFDHMLCPGAGQSAPVMQQQTMALNGCQPNPYPFTQDGTFVTGPWASS